MIFSGVSDDLIEGEENEIRPIVHVHGAHAIHRGTDALKCLMAGADVTMLCSALMRHGLQQLQVVQREMCAWMQEHEYESVEQLKGSMSQQNCANPTAFERAQYMQAISRQPLS